MKNVQFTLVLFPHDRSDVVLSRVVEKALSQVSIEENPVVAGGCFTLEGLERLRARNAVVLALSDFYWTDDSYLAIREKH